MKRLPRLCLLLPLTAVIVIAMVAPAPAQDAGAMVRLLKSGRLPPERVGSVLNLVCQRGNAEDLAYIFEQTVKADGFTGPLRQQALTGLATAAHTRKVRPEVNAEALLPLLDDPDPTTAAAAVRLAAAWQSSALAGPLATRALAPGTSDEARRMALAALTAIGGPQAEETIDKLLAAPDPRLQSYGIAALAGTDLTEAANRAAALLREPAAGAHVGVLLDALLDRQKGSETLATALAAGEIPADNAKLALRHMYLAGRSDAQLADLLTRLAGLHVETLPPTPEQLKALSAEALAQGDPQRGEAIFRRADLGCMKCHAVSGAGGDVGPDLSPVGATSPVDYVITSILHPDLSIKESFLTRNLITSDGMFHQGIVIDRDDNRVIVKDATGRKITIPAADIEEESEGRSLMPKGLANFLTHAEFLDMVRFIGELGKPGPYAIRSQPTIQRWRYLQETPAELADKVPDTQQLNELILGAPAGKWAPFYARVNGTLPLAEISGPANSVLYLRGDVDVSEPGEVTIVVEQPAGITAWVDGVPAPTQPANAVKLEKGMHTVILRVDLAKRNGNDLRVVVDKPAGSAASYTVVGGP